MAKGIAGFGSLSLLWESFSNIWMVVKKNYQAFFIFMTVTEEIVLRSSWISKYSSMPRIRNNI